MSRSDITPCIKIDKPLVVHIFSNVVQIEKFETECSCIYVLNNHFCSMFVTGNITVIYRLI